MTCGICRKPIKKNQSRVLELLMGRGLSLCHRVCAKRSHPQPTGPLLKPMFFPVGQTAGAAFLTKAIACDCGSMAMIVINRDGKTRCITCDRKYQDEVKAEALRD